MSLTFAQSRYEDILQTISDSNPAVQIEEKYQDEYLVYKRGELPQYTVSMNNFFEQGKNLILEAAKRTTTEKADSYPRLTKLVHANGVCVAGTWSITEPSSYTGYFSQGKTGLFIGRVSVALSDTERGFLRGFGVAGKIFPTLDPQEKVSTANFFTADDLGGTTIPRFTDTAVTNEPALSIRFRLIKLLLAINSAFSQADSNPGFRPLYPISELGMASTAVIKTPRWMKLEPVKDTLKNDEEDFRNELNFDKYYPQGLVLNIFVSDTTPSRFDTTSWLKIGQIKLKKSFVSYGCDRQLHFAHPKMK